MINIYLADQTPRIEYTFKLIFETILKCEVSFVTNIDEFKKLNGIKINYSDQSDLGGLFLQPQGLLQCSHLQNQYPEVIEWEEVKALFPVKNSFIPFDVFSATFYLVSRYEEYLPGKKDRHQRFMARNSIAGRNHFIEKPLINIWAFKLAEIIENEFGVKIVRPKFKYLPTIDIDNAWAFKNKGFFRISLSFVKDILKGRWRTFRKRFAVVTRIEKDPYDNYDFMLSTFKQFNFRAVYFFLLNNKGKYDRSLSHLNINYRSLILRLAKTGKIGIHPSYASNKHEKLLSKEVNRLSSITGKGIKRSRQHFLKMSMPKTYRKLIEQGIKIDYSMGYPNRPGFRASIATPFFFFDVLENKVTGLKIKPFQVMDVTLMQYRNLGADDALKNIEKLMRETAKVGGTFISLWHNESMSDVNQWKGWRNVYTEITRIAAEIRDENNN